MAVSRRQIVESIHKGSIKANTRYEVWSRGLWLTDSGVEGLMAAGIAEALGRQLGRRQSLMMEQTFRNIAQWSRAAPRPGVRPATLRDTNRADIVLFNGRNRPTCIIEVKRKWGTKSCLHDLSRIRDLTRRNSFVHGGSLRRGFLAMIIAESETATKTPRARIESKVRKIRRIVEDKFPTKGQNMCFFLGESVRLGSRFREVYGEWEAASLCIEIYTPRQR